MIVKSNLDNVVSQTFTELVWTHLGNDQVSALETKKALKSGKDVKFYLLTSIKLY
jgi:hypothetical protein